LSAEQLEQALAERRKADALAAEKRRLEDQARQRAEAEAEAKRQADVELENARQARRKAERELAQLKADIEARRTAEGGRANQAAVTAERAAEEAAQRKAETEAAFLRDTEEEAAKKAAVEAAAKLHADRRLALATDRRMQAEAEALARCNQDRGHPAQSQGGSRDRGKEPPLEPAEPPAPASRADVARLRYARRRWRVRSALTRDDRALQKAATSAGHRIRHQGSAARPLEGGCGYVVELRRAKDGRHKTSELRPRPLLRRLPARRESPDGCGAEHMNAIATETSTRSP